MFLLLSGQTDITDRLSFCSSHLCFPWTEKLPSVVCLFLCSGLFPSFVPKDNRTEQESVCSSVLCCVCLRRREINRIHTWFILLHLLFVSLDFNSNPYLQRFISSLQQHFSVSKKFGSDFIQCSDVFTGSRLVHV